MDRVRNFLEKINISGELRENEPLGPRTTFKTGGPADVYARPAGTEDLKILLREARADGLSVFILGGGANILVSDRGIRGLVVDMGGFARIETQGDLLTAGAGLPVSAASEAAAEASLAGLDFIYAMPGSVGGAVWMNARCYDSEIRNVLQEVRFLDENLEERCLTRRDPLFDEFGYKRSPFQQRTWIILEAVFRLESAEDAEGKTRLREAMERIKKDRTDKGHFAAPSAGSVFKNNRAFGAPSGAIIDRLGLKGYALGGARVSPLHGNIICNSGAATAAEIRSLVEYVRSRVLEETGFELEPEILFVGDWSGR